MCSKRKLSAKEQLAQLQDDLRRAQIAGDDTEELKYEIENMRILVAAEENES